ncbi:MAG: diguanylate cyclase, partial [Synergistaceae bacterium]|nr:diguanylate cyclase [Synergistaceae bacterium]
MIFKGSLVCSGLEESNLRDETEYSGETSADALFSGDLVRFVENLNEIIFLVGEDREIIMTSKAAREMFDISRAEERRAAIDDFLPKVYIDAIAQRVKNQDAGSMKLTFPVKNNLGHEVMLEARFNWFRMDGKNLLSITCRDINEFIKTLSDLTEREDRYRTIFRESPLGFVHVNSDGFITDCNNAFLRIFGLEKYEVINICLAEDNDLDIYQRFKKAAMDAVVGVSSSHESRFSSVDGEYDGWVRVSFSPVISENNSFLGAVGIVEDITEARNAVDKISFVSSHDALTGLFNRRVCEEAITLLDSQEYLPLAILYADLNCLKLANDAFGHHEGDALLRNASSILREKIGKSGSAYRWGGDEFIAILKNTGQRSAESCVKQIAKACENWTGEGLVPPSMALGYAVKLYND